MNVENSIDQYFYEEDGKYYMLWGSFFGIYIMELDVTDDVMITPKLDTKRQIAGNAYEGINLWKRDGYYYLIGSIGSCCEGQKSTYTTVVARSKDLFGPYVDKQGGQMLDNKHEVILHKNDRFVGTGHNSTLLEDDEKNTWMLYHAFELERLDAQRQVLLDRILWDEDPMASLAVKKTVGPGSTETFTFYLTWNFPNRKAWSETIVGNYYSTRFPDAWEAAEAIVPQIPEMERQTLSFVHAFLKSTYPDVVKEAALFNLATLRSQTVFRLPSGHLMGWEGVMDRFGSCAGSCTHVWNYEVATPFLFGELAKTMRDVEFNYVTKENGLMNFRASLPLSEAAKGNSAAADGQMGCVMKIYRDWQLSGDDEFLQKNWGQVKKVLAYAWTDKGWDGNQDGVMEGLQHNTMDVNYFGPNPQMGFWYMGALKAAEKMALAMKDKTFAKKCNTLFRQGSTWMDANLFNGEYYEHKITDPETFEYLDMRNPDVKVPPFQLGKGCLVDQLVGQYMAHICGLGYLGDKEHIRTTLGSIMKYNYVKDFSRHFNNMRSYVMGDESGLLMASWPKGRLEVPFPYFAEVMTGFEYCAAVGMIYEGME